MSSPAPIVETATKRSRIKKPVEILPVPEVCDLLIAKVQVYGQLVRAMTRLTNQTKANLRKLGISEPTEFTDKQSGSRKYKILPPTPQQYDALVAVNKGITDAKSVLDTERSIIEKDIIRLTKMLPVWKWAEGIRGIGPTSLGCIIGMTGDLSKYANPAKVWKRLGLGLVDGQAQRRTTNVELAMKFGYSPSRRAHMHVVGIGINMAAATKGENGSREYATIYRLRKEYELTKEVNGKPITAGHADKRALRYMEKRFLCDLWNNWNGKTR